MPAEPKSERGALGDRPRGPTREGRGPRPLPTDNTRCVPKGIGARCGTHGGRQGAGGERPHPRTNRWQGACLPSRARSPVALTTRTLA